MLLGRTATVLVAVLYNKQKICHGGQIFCARGVGESREDNCSRGNAVPGRFS